MQMYRIRRLTPRQDFGSLIPPPADLATVTSENPNRLPPQTISVPNLANDYHWASGDYTCEHRQGHELQFQGPRKDCSWHSPHNEQSEGMHTKPGSARTRGDVELVEQPQLTDAAHNPPDMTMATFSKCCAGQPPHMPRSKNHEKPAACLTGSDSDTGLQYTNMLAYSESSADPMSETSFEGMPALGKHHSGNQLLGNVAPEPFQGAHVSLLDTSADDPFRVHTPATWDRVHQHGPTSLWSTGEASTRPTHQELLGNSTTADRAVYVDSSTLAGIQQGSTYPIEMEHHDAPSAVHGTTEPEWLVASRAPADGNKYEACSCGSSFRGDVNFGSGDGFGSCCEDRTDARSRGGADSDSIHQEEATGQQRRKWSRALCNAFVHFTSVAVCFTPSSSSMKSRHWHQFRQPLNMATCISTH